MKNKRVIIDRSSRVRRQRDPIPWKYCVLTVICGLLLVSGFFFAARQHFSAVQLGMGNAELRMRMTKLKDENRKLLLSMERASTPAKIAKLATAYGFTEAPQIVLDFTPANQNNSDHSPPEPVLAYSEARPPIDPPVVNDANQKALPEAVSAKGADKESVSDDQIAALRKKDK